MITDNSINNDNKSNRTSLKGEARSISWAVASETQKIMDKHREEILVIIMAAAEHVQQTKGGASK